MTAEMVAATNRQTPARWRERGLQERENMTEQEKRSTEVEGLATEPISAEILEEPAGALSLITRAEIDIQIATAKRFPRSIVAFKRQALEMATLDEETAGSMFYALPRAGKTIEGPSVRLAEIVGSAWGNIRYAARIVDVGEKYVTAQGVAYDLEKNVSASVEVTRRITNKAGKRYDDDMIGVARNAACSIALRQAIFKVVPFAYVKSIYEAARQTSLGKALTMEQRRQRALDWYAKIGAKPDHVLTVLGRKGVEDIAVDDLLKLQGLKTAIQDGETTFDAALAEATGAKQNGDAEPAPDPKATIDLRTQRKFSAVAKYHGWTPEQVEELLKGEVAGILVSEYPGLIERLKARQPEGQP